MLSRPHFNTAQICMNGHIINDRVDSFPEQNTKYCQICGAETILVCNKCNLKIRGQYQLDGTSINKMKLPLFCHECGNPYPWTLVKKSTVIELVNESEDVSEKDKKVFNDNIDDIIKDSPKTQIASTRLKKFLSKTGSGIGKAVRDIIVDIASETAKKIIWPS